MNRYAGNTGYVERIPEEFPRRNMPHNQPEYYPAPKEEPKEQKNKKPSGLSNILGGLGGLGSKISTSLMETDDILLIVILYLLYRESKDVEFLLIAGAMLFM